MQNVSAAADESVSDPNASQTATLSQQVVIPAVDVK
jgi:hypothetical protein